MIEAYDLLYYVLFYHMHPRRKFENPFAKIELSYSRWKQSLSKNNHEYIVCHYIPKQEEGKIHIYFDDLYAEAFCILKNREDSLEAIQNAMFKVARLDYFPDDFYTYVKTAVRHCALDILRYRSKRDWAETPIEAPLEEVSNNIFDGNSPEQMFIQRQRAMFIQNAVSELEPSLRDVVFLRYFKDMNCGQIAKELDIPIHTVNNRLHRAKYVLRVILQPLNR